MNIKTIEVLPIMYTCKCGYISNRKSNLDTHQDRKTRHDICILIDEIIVQLAKNECHKCNKILQSSRNLRNHELRCNGLDVLQCPTCTKFFKNASGKSEHIKNIKCKPPSAINVPQTLTGKNNRKENKIVLKDEEIDEENRRLQKEIKLKDNDIKLKDEEIRMKDEYIDKLLLGYDVIPNKTKVKPKRGFVTQITKTQIAASQKWCCLICTTLFTGIFHMDHTIPLSFGGEDNLENVTALCVQCHAEKKQNEWKLSV